MENRPDRYDKSDGYYYDNEGIRYEFRVDNLGRFLFSFARFTFKFNSMFRVWKYDYLLKMFGLIFVRVNDNESNPTSNINNTKEQSKSKIIENKVKFKGKQ